MLFAAAYFLMEAGLQFVALLSAIIGAMLLLTSGGKSNAGGVTIHEPMGPNGPIVVEQKMPAMPSLIQLKVKPKWKDRASFEYIMEHTGWWVDKLFRWIAFLFFPKKK